MNRPLQRYILLYKTPEYRDYTGRYFRYCQMSYTFLEGKYICICVCMCAYTYIYMYFISIISTLLRLPRMFYILKILLSCKSFIHESARKKLNFFMTTHKFLFKFIQLTPRIQSDS